METRLHIHNNKRMTHTHPKDQRLRRASASGLSPQDLSAQSVSCVDRTEEATLWLHRLLAVYIKACETLQE